MVVGRVAVFVGKPNVAEKFEEYSRCVGSTTVHVNTRFGMRHSVLNTRHGSLLVANINDAC